MEPAAAVPVIESTAEIGGPDKSADARIQADGTPHGMSVPVPELAQLGSHPNTSGNFLEAFGKWWPARTQRVPNRVKSKVVFVGDGACGKSCAARVFTHGTFPEGYGYPDWEVATVDILTKGNTVLELEIQNSPGEEDYDRLRPLLYPGAHAVAICFAIDSPDSLDNVQEKASQVGEFLDSTC